MARKRASMREGPLAELFRATEAAQRAKEGDQPAAPGPEEETQVRPPERPREETALEATVEHVYDFEEEREARGARRQPKATVPSEAPVP
jgi:hypothetical protein